MDAAALPRAAAALPAAPVRRGRRPRRPARRPPSAASSPARWQRCRECAELSLRWRHHYDAGSPRRRVGPLHRVSFSAGGLPSPGGGGAGRRPGGAAALGTAAAAAAAARLFGGPHQAPRGVDERVRGGRLTRLLVLQEARLDLRSVPSTAASSRFSSSRAAAAAAAAEAAAPSGCWRALCLASSPGQEAHHARLGAGGQRPAAASSQRRGSAEGDCGSILRLAVRWKAASRRARAVPAGPRRPCAARGRPSDLARWLDHSHPTFHGQCAVGAARHSECTLA
jgi:hypothetical protein